MSITPRAQWPVAIHLGVHRSMLDGLQVPAVADGYTRFSESIRLTRFELAASRRRPRTGPNMPAP